MCISTVIKPLEGAVFTSQISFKCNDVKSMVAAEGLVLVYQILPHKWLLNVIFDIVETTTTTQLDEFLICEFEFVAIS